MSDRPLVSVITPTWQRPDLLLGAIADVRAQTYGRLEHVIVIDGNDRDSADVVRDEQVRETGDRALEYVELGRNWSSFLSDSFCAAPTTVGMLVASGAYQMWLADDERMTLDHIEGLVDALEAADADFAYGRVQMYMADDPGRRWTIGADPPTYGEITNVLYRAEILKRGLYPFGAGMSSDWTCISRWLSFGARYAFVPRVTLTHRADH